MCLGAGRQDVSIHAKDCRFHLKSHFAQKMDVTSMAMEASSSLTDRQGLFADVANQNYSKTHLNKTLDQKSQTGPTKYRTVATCDGILAWSATNAKCSYVQRSEVDTMVSFVGRLARTVHHIVASRPLKGI
jgi:hypothetical protein